MSTPTEPPYLTGNTYVIDLDDAAEMARLLHQDRLITQHMGGLFPERSDLSTIHDVLDLACGPGGWVIQVAQASPEKQVIGVDLSIRMIMYARAQALIHDIPNARFRMMDVLKPLDFPDQSFDLVNGRFLFAFMPPAAWPSLLQESMRILRPGGIIRLIEGEYGLSNSLACEQLRALCTRALWVAGQSFSPDGQHFGITPMLGPLLRQGGYQNIQQVAHAIDYSSGVEAHDGVFQDHMTVLKLAQPFLIRCGVTTQQEVERLYQQAMAEMLADDFCAIQFLLTVWGERP